MVEGETIVLDEDVVLTAGSEVGTIVADEHLEVSKQPVIKHDLRWTLVAAGGLVVIHNHQPAFSCGDPGSLQETRIQSVLKGPRPCPVLAH